MVFSSVPVYLDPHNNWPQQQSDGVGENNHLSLLLPPLSTDKSGGIGTVAGSIKSGSMIERARLAKLPQPEAALKCPRCESTNTKFCYFNNYSLSQPRHFCKTCRRYWTLGGALRNVPVGGGCRRNKRSKVRKRLKSPVTIDHQPHQAGASSSKSCCTTDMVGNLVLPPPPQVPFFPSLPHLSDYAAGDIGSNFAGIQLPAVATGGGNGGTNLEFQMGSWSSGGGPVLSRFAEQWRLQQQVQQFPILAAGLEPQSRIYPFEGDQVEGVDQVGSKQLDSGVTMRMEENQGFNLSRNFLGVQGNINDQYWGSNYAWSCADLSGF